jgi:hypothetical protein
MKILISLATLVLLSAKVQATVIYVGSDAGITTNNSGHATVDLSGRLHPNPSWGEELPGSEWISYGPTGDHDDPGFFSPADGTVVLFTTEFVLSGTITGASLTVMADDSTSVVLNGHTLLTANTKRGSTCSKKPIGCVESTEGVFTFSSLGLYMVDGTNILSFGVVQVHGSSFGLDFAGSVDEAAATPEPGSLAFIGGGLLVLAALRWRNHLLI